MKPTIGLRLPALLFLSALPGLPQAETQHWQDPQYIAESFIDISLNREHGTGSGTLNKWQQPIYYQIDDRTADTALHQRMVDQQLRHLSAITGHQITAAKSAAEANLQIIFGSEQTLDITLRQDFGLSDKSFRHQLIHSSVCLGRIRVGSNGTISSAVVLIPVDRARAHAKLMSCVVEELTQVMGLVNDSTAVYPSIFNDRSFNDFLSGLDYLLLKLLYSPALTAGMRQAELREQLNRLVSSAEFKRLILSAERDVRHNSLESWLN